MNGLVQQTIDAHGGFDRWRRFEHVSAHLRNAGVLWTLKQRQGILDHVNVRVALRTTKSRQEASSHYTRSSSIWAPHNWSRYFSNS